MTVLLRSANLHMSSGTNLNRGSSANMFFGLQAIRRSFTTIQTGNAKEVVRIVLNRIWATGAIKCPKETGSCVSASYQAINTQR